MTLSILFSHTPFLGNMVFITYVLLVIFVIYFFLKKIFQSKPFKKFLLKLVNLIIIKFYSNTSVVKIRKAIYTSSLWIGAISEAVKNTLKKSQNTSMLVYLVMLLKCVYWQMKLMIYKLGMKINYVRLLPFIVKKLLIPDITAITIDYPINDKKYFL